MLYFSITSFLMSAYLGTMNEQVLSFLFDYDIFVRTRIQIFLMISITLCFLRFTHFYFERFSSYKTTNILSWFSLSLFILIFNNPQKSIFVSFGVTQIIITFCILIDYGYIFLVLLKAIINKADSYGYIILITVSMFCYWLSIFLKTFLEINPGYIPIFLIINIMAGIALLMGHQLYLDYIRANELSEKLILNDKILETFLITAPQELQGPLQQIDGLVKSLIEGRKGVLNPSQLEDLYFVHEETRRLERLAEDLSEASTAEKSRIVLKPGCIDINQTVDNIMKEIKITIPQNKDLALRKLIPENFPMVSADPGRFRQIIYNLLDNAVKNTDAGEITVTAGLKDGFAEFKVKDTGVGIERKYLTDIFKVFYKREREGSSKGLGLGLPIAKYLIESHGGSLEVESEINKGTIFTFTMPICNFPIEEAAAAVFDTKLQSGSIGNKSTLYKGKPVILIVGDDPLCEKNLSEILCRQEFNTLSAHSGERAIKVLKENKVDLVILNLTLEDMPGAELCKKIRKDHSMTELPILFLMEVGHATGFINTNIYGINDFQKKPVDPDVFVSRIQSMLLMKASVEENLNKEYQYFYSQISPHFLYNTLNTIIGLSYNDSEKTREALYNLSVYFRGKLEIHRQKSLIPIESELELTMAYLEIEKIRFGDRLKVKVSIEENIEAMIPPLSLQPLVENSIRHGIAHKEKGGVIGIEIKRISGGFIEVLIEDDGIGMSLKKQESILHGKSQSFGFPGVLKRIKIYKGASLSLTSEPGKGTQIRIVLPEVRYYESSFN